MWFLKRRFIIAMLCLLVSAALTWKLFETAESTKRTVKVVRAVDIIEKGTLITANSLNVVEIGAYGANGDALKSIEEIEGAYAFADIYPGDDITRDKLTLEGNPDDDFARKAQEEDKAVVSIGVSGVSAALSGKLRIGDVVSAVTFVETGGAASGFGIPVGYSRTDETSEGGQMSITDYAKGFVKTYPELTYLEIVAVANNRAKDIDVSKFEAETKILSGGAASDDAIPASVTFMVDDRQALSLVEAENIGSIHLIFRGRGKHAKDLLAMAANREAKDEISEDTGGYGSESGGDESESDGNGDVNRSGDDGSGSGDDGSEKKQTDGGGEKTARDESSDLADARKGSVYATDNSASSIAASIAAAVAAAQGPAAQNPLSDNQGYAAYNGDFANGEINYGVDTGADDDSADSVSVNSADSVDIGIDGKYTAPPTQEPSLSSGASSFPGVSEILDPLKDLDGESDPTKTDAMQVGAAQPDAAQPDAAQAKAPQISATQIPATQTETPQVNAQQTDAPQAPVSITAPTAATADIANEAVAQGAATANNADDVYEPIGNVLVGDDDFLR